MNAVLSGVDYLWSFAPYEYSDGFNWVLGVTPFSSVEFLAASIVGYLVVTYGIRYLVPFKAMELKKLQALHNAFLCLASIIMFSGTIFELLRQFQAGKTIFDLGCDPPGNFAKGRISFWVWMFHLSKFYEFLDTLFLSLSKSNIRFLHTYHHVLTLIATYYGLYSTITIQWAGMVNNTLVHIFMYYYYAVRSLGYTVWWKEYLTQLQMFQFCFNTVALIIWGWWSLTAPADLKCHGDFISWGITLLANVTFFYLFFQMYLQLYRKPKSGDESKDAKKKKSE